MEIKKVLVFKQSSIGDCLMAKYFLENVRAQYPGARCGIVVGSRGAMLKDLFSAYPWIEVIEANRKNPAALLKLFRRFLGSDIVVTEYTGGAVGLGTKIVARLLAYRGKLIGFYDISNVSAYIYDALVPHGNRSISPRLLEQRSLRSAGIPVSKEWLTYEYLPQPHLLSEFGVEEKKYVVVHLFSGSTTRGLSPRRQQDLLDELAKAFPDMPLLLTGTQKERDQLAKLALPTQAKLVATSVQEVAMLIDRSAVMVSVGTGTSHIASSLRAPLVVLVNCQGLQWEGQEQWGDAPKKVFCNAAACPQGHSFAGYAKCIDSVDMAEVAAAAKKFVTMQ